MVNAATPDQDARRQASFESERLAELLEALEAALAEMNRPLLEHSPLPGLSKLATRLFVRLQRRQSVFDQRAADLLHLLAVEVEAQRLRIERLEKRHGAEAPTP